MKKRNFKRRDLLRTGIVGTAALGFLNTAHSAERGNLIQSENAKQLDAGLNEIVWLYAKKLAEIEARENEKHLL